MAASFGWGTLAGSLLVIGALVPFPGEWQVWEFDHAEVSAHQSLATFLQHHARWARYRRRGNRRAQPHSGRPVLRNRHLRGALLSGRRELDVITLTAVRSRVAGLSARLGNWESLRPRRLHACARRIRGAFRARSVVRVLAALLCTASLATIGHPDWLLVLPLGAWAWSGRSAARISRDDASTRDSRRVSNCISMSSESRGRASRTSRMPNDAGSNAICTTDASSD